MAEEVKIKIECENCGQQFDVGPALKNKMVECGECKHQFRVDNKSIVKASKRHFPGEKTGDLSMFSKKIDSVEVSNDVNFRTAAYDKQVDPNSVMPLGGERIACIFGGILLSVFVVLVYVLGHDPDERAGLMLDVTNEKKFVLSSFTALLAALLVIYGCRKNRVVGVLLALILGGAVVAMPFFYNEYFSPSGDSVDLQEVVVKAKPEDITEYKSKLGYGPVEKAIEDKGVEKVAAVAVIGAKLENLETIKGFLKKVTKDEGLANVLSGTRRVGDETISLFIYSDVKVSLQEMAEEVKELGSVEAVREGLRVIEVRVDPSKLITRTASILQDESSPSYYALNYAELNHLNPERQGEAIRRLGNTKKIGRRADIRDRLKSKLDEIGYPYKEDVVRTLMIWSLPEDKIGPTVRGLATDIVDLQKDVPAVYLDYLIKFDVESIEHILLYSWKSAPASMEATIISAGKRGEQAIVRDLSGMEKRYYKAAASILRKIGTMDAIPAIEGVMKKGDEDQRKALKAAVDEIKSRG